MKKYAVLMFALASVTLFAQTPQELAEFKKGNQLYNRGKFQDAAVIFQQLAEKGSDAIKAKALFYKALADGKNHRVKLADALKSVEAVQDAKLKAYAGMTAYYHRNQWAKVVSIYDKEAIENWPEDYAYIGWLYRGDSRNYRRMYDKAEQDLLLAEKNAGSDDNVYMFALNSLYRLYTTKKQYDKALAILEKVRGKAGPYAGHRYYLAPMTNCAAVFIGLQKLDDGHKMLDEVNQKARVEKRNDAYACQYFIGRGKLYQAQGDKAKALACYQKAAKCNAHKFYIGIAKELAKKLQNEGGK